MKKFTLSTIAVLAMSTFAIAGGDIAPVEPVVEVEEPIVDESGFYVGLGYSYIKTNVKESGFPELDITGDAIGILAGYNFNRYIAVEGRYGTTFGDITYEDDLGSTDTSGDMTNWGIYLKPMYPMGELTLYGLLGYGELTIDDAGVEESDNGFQWGLGANYTVNENVGVFVDYTRLYDDTGFDTNSDADVVADSINIGFTYTF
jgi:opacity protein-like surface antigen